MSVGEACALIEALKKPLLVMSGSGISASSGLATFSAADGLYERARKRFKLKHGMDLFQWWFYEERPADAQSFLARMCERAMTCAPTKTHEALFVLEKRGFLRRHYTMNIDGLQSLAGATLWHPRDAIGRDGKTVELHGNLRELVDAASGDVYAVDAAALARLKANKPAFGEEEGDRPKPLYNILVSKKSTSKKKRKRGGQQRKNARRDPPLGVRLRVMFYDDHEHDRVIDSEAVYKLISTDVPHVDIVLWLGISFEQSASCDYLRRVHRTQPDLVHLVVNPSPEAAFNARSCLDNPDAADLRFIRATSDDLFAALLVHTTLFNDPPRLASSSSSSS
ncbi:hypothetical protein CTAYLR_010193 [Chrysophaeum taylorii]|uniref:Deacetylase sirtuin-type domain-containing protein n=1 Tax=Chrysophaeum taylorii TaxID=2483200 RepID=A0AAD7UDL6_9STRA|nr:hypothetical protein CTAYLR_010193 [Chrysophaeum taylorii]